MVPDGARFRECAVDLTWSGIPPSCIQGNWSIVFNYFSIIIISGVRRGIVESSSNEFIVGFASSYSRTSQALFVTTNDQENIPFLVSGNKFNRIYSVRNTGYTYTGIPSSYIGKGIDIKAKPNKKITVHGRQTTSYPFYSVDLYLAINVRPTDNVKEYEYYSIPYNYSSLLHLVATEDNTIVNLGSSSIMLDRLQTHQINESKLLTSIRVVSNKPLSVISAKNCVGSCDFLTEQLLPSHLWGRRFLVASFLGLKNGESLRILASKLPTMVTIACAENNIHHVVNLESGQGQWRDVKLDEQPGGVRERFCVLEATNPVHVLQFARVSVGDSYMMTIPAVEQYGEYFTGFYTSNTSPFTFVNLYVTPEHFVPQGIVVDGSTVLDWTTVRCVSGEICGYISRPVLRRRYYHTIQHQNPRGRIGISAYGFDTGWNSTYGYPASMYMPSSQGI